MGILRDRVLENKQERTTNDLQADGRAMRAQLRSHQQLSGKRRAVTAVGAGQTTVIHGLGYVPRGWNIELGNNNQITLVSKDDEKLVLANAAAADAALTLWIY